MPMTSVSKTAIAVTFLLASVPFGPASATSVELQPGRWTVNHSVRAPSLGIIHNETETFCLSPSEASISMEQVLENLNFAQCRASGVIITQGTGRANLDCTYPSYGNVRANGTTEANYTDTKYTIRTRMVGVGMGTMTVSHTSVGKWSGKCK